MTTALDPRERLALAAAQLFHARSYGSVGIQDVCTAAGVRRGSFYYYYATKEELALVALERSVDRLVAAAVAPAFEGDGATWARLEDFVSRLADYHDELRAEYGAYAGCPIANLAEELATLSEEIRRSVIHQFERLRGFYVGFIVDAMERGDIPPGDAGALASDFFALVQGCLLRVKVENDSVSLRGLAGPLARMIGLAR